MLVIEDYVGSDILNNEGNRNSRQESRRKCILKEYIIFPVKKHKFRHKCLKFLNKLTQYIGKIRLHGS